MSPHSSLALSPSTFMQRMRDHDIRRFHFVLDDQGQLQASHPVLQDMADELAANQRDFQQHEGMFFQLSRTGDTLLAAFIHRTCRGQAAGGLRYWGYSSMSDVLSDGLRLAAGMTRKIALAGLWWGGGKGILARDVDAAPLSGTERISLYREYGELISALKGCYYTAEDVGTGPDDMAEVFSRTRFVTCIPPDRGGSGNPSAPTARGVVAGMIAALEDLGMGTLKDKSIAVQGLGHVAQPMIEELLSRGVGRVVATDIDPVLVKKMSLHHAGSPFKASCVSRDDLGIFSSEVDILAPCATGAILNRQTIPMLGCRIVCGAANNQLEDPVGDDNALLERGITYVPDFLTNRMGIVNCADEGAGYVDHDPLVERHLDRDWVHSIHRTTLDVLQRSRDTGIPPGQVATRMADELALEEHPIIGHRAQQIIRDLAAAPWHLVQKQCGKVRDDSGVREAPVDFIQGAAGRRLSTCPDRDEHGIRPSGE